MNNAPHWKKRFLWKPKFDRLQVQTKQQLSGCSGSRSLEIWPLWSSVGHFGQVLFAQININIVGQYFKNNIIHSAQK